MIYKSFVPLISIIPESDVRRTEVTLGVIGGLTGAIAGLGSRPEENDLDGVIDTFSAGYYAGQGAIIGVAIGGAIGLAIGSASNKFEINRQMHKYHGHQQELRDYLYVPDR